MFPCFDGAERQPDSLQLSQLVGQIGDGRAHQAKGTPISFLT